MVISKIMVPVDGSALAETALPTALALSGKTGADIRLVRVRTDEDRPEDSTDADPYLDTLTESVSAVVTAPASVSATLLRGDPAQLLCQEAQAGADIVVMASHGHGGVARAWLGSVADAVVAQCRRPVVVVKPDEPGVTAILEPGSVHHIVVPLDGTRSAEVALEPALGLQRLFTGRVTFLRVIPASDLAFSALSDTSELTAELLERSRADARVYLESVRSRYEGTAEIDIEVVVHRNPALGVADFVAQHGVDLVVVGTRGRRGVARAILGSVADKVVRGAPAPVLVVRGTEEEAPGGERLEAPALVAGAQRTDEAALGYRRVMLPLDGSSMGERALPLAATIAERADATLHVVSVAELSDRVRDREEYVGGIVARIEGEYGCRVQATVQSGNVADRLLHEANRGDVDLTVMTTHGRGGLSRLWFGSVATRVLDETDKPLVLVRPDEGAGSGDVGPQFTKILVPLDGTTPAEECLTHIVALGGLFDAAYHLTRVVRVPTEISTEYFEAERVRALDYLEFHAGRMRAEGLTVSTSVWLEQQPGRVILAVCANEGCDSIAMATGGWDGIGRVLLGSTADKVLRGAEVPMLLLGPRLLGG